MKTKLIVGPQSNPNISTELVYQCPPLPKSSRNSNNNNHNAIRIPINDFDIISLFCLCLQKIFICDYLLSLSKTLSFS